MLLAGQLDGGYCGGDAINPLLTNVAVVKQLLTLVTGTSLAEQLVAPPVFHTG
jgi:hypothetical protein